MQWDAGPQAGFSTNPQTWLPIPSSYKTINVAVESKDPYSELEWFKRIIALRRTNPALHDGGMTMLNTANPNVLSCVSSTGTGPAVVVAMNFTSEPRTISLDWPGRALPAPRQDAGSGRRLAGLSCHVEGHYAAALCKLDRKRAVNQVRAARQKKPQSGRDAGNCN